MASGIWHLACQTYALKLFNFHRSLNQTQFLFSSARSFRVAKSETLSAGLSPRSRRLPLLFKFSGLPSLPSLSGLSGLLSLLRLFRFSKSALFFVVLLLSYSQSSVALTAYTSKYIVGSAPYLTFDNGRTKATSTDKLLSIRLQDGRVITPSSNPSSSTNPISLPYVGSNLSHIEMIVPSSVSSVSISDLITRYNYWRDDDGDEPAVNGVSGNISVSFTDKDGNTVSRNEALSKCKAPYRVRLSSTGGYLQTQYGVPNRTSFSGATVDYYINPYGSPVVCHARPNLLLGGTTGIDSRDNHLYAGPASIWNPDKGFLTQSTDSSSYDRNFPTTGADGLYFDLEMPAGVDGSQLSWTVNAVGSIRAEVSWVKPNNSDRWIINKSSYVTRVTLHGPRADRTQMRSSNPRRLTPSLSLPQRFELVGRDGRGNEVRYGFVLKQWFVNRGDKRGTQSNHSSWCSSLGYRLARGSDLTNAVCSGWNSGSSCEGFVGATPSSSNNVYMRHIGAGFFTEWGYMGHYADAGFVDGGFWASDATGSYGFTVYSNSGIVGSVSVSVSDSAVCTAP
ncbi:hypothetical protein GA0061081_101105 [Gilliamella bombicola]|uniref:Uncharacterized protein n=1 Tax=Gilliamella bombicola TaxID=1798182 RepID=A0A1C3YTA6_9GAMM|nr:hypothetical protein [Gilliamella bombicola]SCB73355.1 hypothetical protein GA0061081_101105 [Gilliamella bombicola]